VNWILRLFPQFAAAVTRAASAEAESARLGVDVKALDIALADERGRADRAEASCANLQSEIDGADARYAELLEDFKEAQARAYSLADTERDLRQEIGHLKARAEAAEAERQKWETVADRLSLRYQGFRLTGSAAEPTQAAPQPQKDITQRPQRMLARDAQRIQTAEFWKTMQAQVAANDAHTAN
jgi:chromosome segregation ATPase